MYNPIPPPQVGINVEIEIANVQERLEKRIGQAEKVGLVVGNHSPTSTLTSLTPPSLPVHQESKSPAAVKASPATKPLTHPTDSITKSQGDAYMSTSLVSQNAPVSQRNEAPLIQPRTQECQRPLQLQQQNPLTQRQMPRSSP